MACCLAVTPAQPANQQQQQPPPQQAHQLQTAPAGSKAHEHLLHVPVLVTTRLMVKLYGDKTNSKCQQVQLLVSSTSTACCRHAGAYLIRIIHSQRVLDVGVACCLSLGPTGCVKEPRQEGPQVTSLAVPEKEALRLPAATAVDVGFDASVAPFNQHIWDVPAGINNAQDQIACTWTANTHVLCDVADSRV